MARNGRRMALRRFHVQANRILPSIRRARVRTPSRQSGVDWIRGLSDDILGESGRHFGHAALLTLTEE